MAFIPLLQSCFQPSLTNHAVLCTVGIADPGLLTLAQNPDISEFSGIT